MEFTENVNKIRRNCENFQRHENNFHGAKGEKTCFEYKWVYNIKHSARDMTFDPDGYMVHSMKSFLLSRQVSISDR